MSLIRFEKLEPERQRRVLSSAAYEFAAHGFEGVSLSRIAEAAGMSKPALYYYFQDKADLFATAVQAAWGELLAAALPGAVAQGPREAALDVESLDAASFWPTLKRFHEATLARCREEPWLVTAAKLIYHPEAAGGAGPALVELLSRAQATLRRVLRRGQELGVVRTDLPEELLVAVMAGADQAADHWMLDHWDELTPERREDLAGRMFEIARAVASPPAAGRT